ncbi:MAG: hypothetical protein ABJC79_07515 [Acidimicrobiia bacterium]
MGDDARLALTKVRIGRSMGSLYVFDDRIEITTDDGDRTIPITEVERVANRRNWRGSRLLLALKGGQVVQVRRLGPNATTVAHRTILAVARAAH